MSFTPTDDDGGRVAKGNTPWGRYVVLWGPGRELISAWMMDSEPEPESREGSLSVTGAPSPRRSVAAPGDLFAGWVYVLTMGTAQTKSCGECGRRRAWLNWIGWRGLTGRLVRLI